MTDCFLLDSDICIYLLKDFSDVLSRRIREQVEGSLLISSITLAEVGLGVREDARQSTALRHFLDDVIVMPFDADAAARYATLSFKRGGFDRLIAAHALALDLPLVTNNVRHLADVPGLKVENWTLPA